MTQTTTPPTATREPPARRLALAVLWIAVFTIPWQGTFELGGLTKATGLLAALAGGFAVLVTGRRTRLADFHVLTAAFAAWAALSTLWTIDRALTSAAVATMFELLAVVVLIAELAPDRDRATSLARAYVLGCVVLTVEVVLAQLHGDIVDNRVRLADLQPNDIAYTLCLALPFAWYLARQRPPLKRAAYVLFIVAALYAVVLTASRGGLLLGGVACLIIPWTLVEGNRRRLIGLGFVAVLLIPVVLSQLPTEQINRLSTTSSELESGDLNQRTELWAAAWGIWSDHPLDGVGSGASRDAIQARTGILLGAHNTFLSVAAELGVVGLVLFCLVLVAAYRRSAVAWGIERKLVIVQALVVIIGIQVRHWEYQKALWVTIAVTMGIAAAADARRGRRLPYAQERTAGDAPAPIPG